MSIISFYPGPSRVYSNITEYIYEAYKDQVLSINHRSEQFMNLSSSTKDELKRKLDIPSDYEIMFISSATEAWEIISQSLVKRNVQAFYNGAFGKKWAGYAKKLGNEVAKVHFDVNQSIPVDKLNKKAEWLFVTQNETSNGTHVSMDSLKELHSAKSKSQLIAVDATSSMAGVELDFTLGDIWFASVQKCFGLPAGMALLIASPGAIEKAKVINENNHYNSFLNVLNNHLLNQTHYTPNVLLIYLLYRTMSISKGIQQVNKKTEKRFSLWSEFFSKFKNFSWLVDNPELRSKTVLAINTSKAEKVKKLALKYDIVIGNGYGEWKESTIRIANFPAIKTREIEKLTKFFSKNYN